MNACWYLPKTFLWLELFWFESPVLVIISVFLLVVTVIYEIFHVICNEIIMLCYNTFFMPTIAIWKFIPDFAWTILFSLFNFDSSLRPFSMRLKSKSVKWVFSFCHKFSLNFKNLMWYLSAMHQYFYFATKKNQFLKWKTNNESSSYIRLTQ